MAVQRQSSLFSLPSEIILDSLARIEYTPGHLSRLRLVCRKFDQLLKQYEHSLALQIVRLQFPENILLRFPGLCPRGSGSRGCAITGKILDQIYVRLCTLSRIERNCHNIRFREGKQAAWMRPEWINVQSAGMYLLYRLHDSGSYQAQSSLIKTLPATSLAVLLFTLILSVHQLRSDGPDILLPTRPLTSDVLRFEVELACEELLLQHGPAYHDALLCHSESAIRLLKLEVKGMEARQLPQDGKPSPKTLIAELRCALADTLKSDVRDNGEDMWSTLANIQSFLDADDLVKIVNGYELEFRKRQDSGVGL